MVLVKSGKGISKAITQISLKTNVQRKHVYIYTYIFLHRLFFLAKRFNFSHPPSLLFHPHPQTRHLLHIGLGNLSIGSHNCKVEWGDVQRKQNLKMSKKGMCYPNGVKKGKNSILAVCVCVCLYTHIHIHPIFGIQESK